jgi:hypothetical protein
MEDITKKVIKARVNPREIATSVISSNSNTRDDLKVPINLEQVCREQELLLPVIRTAATVVFTTKVDGLEDYKTL